MRISAACELTGIPDLLQAFLDNSCYKSWQHDPNIRTTDGVHPNVQIYYSPSIWEWMTTGKRQGDVPEAAMLVKEQYGDPTHPTTLTDWALMIKDRYGAWDGWYWADLVPGGQPDFAAIRSSAGAEYSELSKSRIPIRRLRAVLSKLHRPAIAYRTRRRRSKTHPGIPPRSRPGPRTPRARLPGGPGARPDHHQE